MAEAAMQGADQQRQEQFWGSVSCRPEESNQQPSDNKTLGLSLNHHHPHISVCDRMCNLIICQTFGG